MVFTLLLTQAPPGWILLGRRFVVNVPDTGEPIRSVRNRACDLAGF
jgi:hypothetical protein